MRSMIDKFVAALLNEERETASELLRNYIIAKAQDIHENLRQGEHPVLADDVHKDIDAEHYFTDDDLADDDGSSDVTADAMASDDVAADDDADAADVAADDADMAADDANMDADGLDGDEGSTDDRLDDLEAQLDDLTAEFERMMQSIDGDDSDDDDDVLGADDEVTSDVDGNAHEEEMAEGDMSSDISHDDDFDDISEAVIDELEKIKTVNTDGRELGNKTFKQNTTSLPSARDKSAGPIKSKNVTHTGFDREAAPKSDRLPRGINTQDKATARLKPESTPNTDGRDSGTNKTFKQNTVSPVAKPKK